jgi:nucleoid-associated protein YgaU
MRKTSKTFYIFITIFLLLSPGFVSADFEDLGAGSRAIGLGNSFTALADDPFGMYYNPAGLGFIRTGQAGGDLGKMYAGLDDGSQLMNGFVSVLLPVTLAKWDKAQLGTVGLGYKYFSLLENYQESTYYLSFGRAENSRWSWGLNLKFLEEKYTLDDYLRRSPVFDYGNRSGVNAFSFDAGVLVNLAPRLFVGASVLDINEPNVGLAQKDTLPASARLGVAWKDTDQTWAFETVFKQQCWNFSTGVEKSLGKVFQVRAGAGFGQQDFFDLAAGFSINFYRTQLDYSFSYPLSGIQDISGSHRMSVVYRFGNKQKSEMAAGSLEYDYSLLKDELAVVKKDLAETRKEKKLVEEALVEESTLRIKEKIHRAVDASQTDQRKDDEEPTAKHVVAENETLQSIAKKYFGDAKSWPFLYEANKEDVGRAGMLKAGQVLKIPDLSKAPPAEPAAAIEIPKQLFPRTPVTAGQFEGQVQTIPVESQPVTVQIIPIESVVLSTVTGPSAVPSAPEPAVAAPPVSQDVKPKSEPKAGPKPTPKEKTLKKISIEKLPGLQGPQKHVVQSGENLRTIAQKYYNNSERWKDIYNANKEKIISGQVTPGQELIVP